MLILHVVEIGPLWTLCRDSYLRLQHLHPSMFPMQKVEQAAKNATAPYYCSLCFYFNTLLTFVSSKNPSHLKENYGGRWIKSGNDTTHRESTSKNLWFCMAMISDSFILIPRVLEARLQHPTPAAHRSKRPGVRMSWRVLQNYVKPMLWKMTTKTRMQTTATQLP